MTDSADRRSVLASLGAAIGTLAGCQGPGTGGTGGEATDVDATGTEATGADGTEVAATDTDETSTPELDLREANVVDVAVEASGEDRYEFDVTLYHDDSGEDGYADWWQVETLDGSRLGRRELLHGHGTQEFTRSETIDVPPEYSCVVVRGHDQTHEYGGQVMLVNLDTGAPERVRQGSDGRQFDDESCP